MASPRWLGRDCQEHRRGHATADSKDAKRALAALQAVALEEVGTSQEFLESPNTALILKRHNPARAVDAARLQTAQGQGGHARQVGA